MTEEVARQPIDLINFSILSFLSAGTQTAKSLQALLDNFTGMEISRTPLFRRMRGLAESGFISEEKVDAFGTVQYTLTEAGKEFCVSWANTLQVLTGLALYTLEYTKTKEYEDETK